MPNERVLVYRDTVATSGPPVAVFGREPNNAFSEPEDKIGHFEFDPSVFWNMSWGLLARSVGKTPAQLKRESERRGHGPLVLCNASPIPVAFGAYDKESFRRAHALPLVREHIARVFRLLDEYLPGRVKLVVMSIGEQNVFYRVTRAALEEQCRSRDMHFVDVPYFRQGVSNHSIDNALDQRSQQVLRETVSEFLAAG